MKAERPTVRCVIEKSKKRGDGTYPVYILVTWKFRRSKESTGIWLSEKDYRKGVYKTNKMLSKRLYDIEHRVSELLEEGMDFTPKDVLSTTTRMTPEKIINEMCRVKKLSPRTSKGYMTTHRSLQSYFGDYSLEDLTLPIIQGYARTIRVSPSAMSFYLKDLKSLLGYAKERGYVKKNVMEKWKFKADGFRDREKPKSRSIYEIKEYVKLWNETDKPDIREAIGIWLSGFVFCGLSLIDLMNVDWCSLEETFVGDGMYYSFTVNRRKTREIAHCVSPVTDLSKSLLEFLKTSPWEGNGHYSAKINRLLKKIDPTLTYYQCRHSFASLLVGSRTPLNTIASMLGRSVNGLSTYIHRVTETEVLSEASKALLFTEDDIKPTIEEETEVFETLITD